MREWLCKSFFIFSFCNNVIQQGNNNTINVCTHVCSYVYACVFMFASVCVCLRVSVYYFFVCESVLVRVRACVCVFPCFEGSCFFSS